MDSFHEQSLEHLAKMAQLARLELDPNEKEKLLVELEGILGYFAELKLLDTSDVEPMNGGTGLKNIFREDEKRENTNTGEGINAFPESEEGFLKVPPVFN